MKFIPGGRYLYYAGRPLHFYNNCFLLGGTEDTREEWGGLLKRSSDCLMSGGGIGADYSIFRPRGARLARTGGTSSGPIPLMHSVNEVGRNVMQGGSRRSAIYASLNWQHGDAPAFLVAKDWHSQKVEGTDYTVWDLKNKHFEYRAPLDQTNISLNYDDAWLNNENRARHETFVKNVRQAMMTGEPGFSFNFGAKERDTLRNACLTGETPILTDKGYYPIGELVGHKTNVWNGAEWSEVTPFSTGTNELVRVVFTDGSSITCTPYHKFLTIEGFNNDKVTRVEAEHLAAGSKLQKWDMPCVDVGARIETTDAYSQGFYSGDGSKGYTNSSLYAPKFVCETRLTGTFGVSLYGKRKYWNHGAMLAKDYVPVNATMDYKLNWLAGLLDSDGTLTSDTNGNGFQVASVDHSFLLNVRLMLSTMGVRAKVVSGNAAGMRAMPDGRGGLKDYECQETKRLLIGNSDTYALVGLGLKLERLQPHANPPQRDARQYVRVKSVEWLGEEAETFCVTEPLRNQFTVNGLVTGNCCEVTSADDSDVCNLGSVNLGNIETIEELREVVRVASAFLACGTVRADLPYAKVYEVREKNRRLGLGLMGIHEWLLKRRAAYVVTDELKAWLGAYETYSERGANDTCDKLGISRPVAYRAIAPTGTIGMLASTTTGIEPLFACAYKRRYFTEGHRWKYEYVVDVTADQLIREYDLKPEEIDTAHKMSNDFERRIKFQADVQDHVDMAISSTINLPAWGTDLNNEDRVTEFAETLSKYAPRLRGFTAYPDGSRGGQPLTDVDYHEALKHKGVVFDEFDPCTGGVCGI